MDKESKDPVWQLLGKQRNIDIDPFFSRNCVRAARQQDQGSTLSFSRFWNRVFGPQLVGGAFALGATAAVVIALTGAETTPSITGFSEIAATSPTGTEAIGDSEPTAAASLYEEIDTYGDLVAAADIQMLGDDDIERLLFY